MAAALFRILSARKLTESLSDMFIVAIASLDLFTYNISLIQLLLKPNFQNIIMMVHRTLHQFNFHTSHSVQKYFSNKILFSILAFTMEV